MTESREIGPLRGPQFDVPTNRAEVPHSVQRRPAKRDRDPQVDKIEIHSASQIVLELIRERVLNWTRQELRVDASQGGVRFVVDSVPTLEAYVSRLISEQNMIASRRRGEWPEAELDAAVERATERGMSEAIEILEELGRLDSAAFTLISDVLGELQRKVSASMP